MKKMAAAVVISAVIAVSGFLGSAYYADVSAIEKSEISLSNASFSEFSLTYCKLKLNVEVTNPSSRSISNLSVKFDIYLTDNYVGNGYFPEISIPVHSSRTRAMTITIYYAELTGGVVNMLEKGKVTITLKGEVEGSVLYDLMSFSQKFNASYSLV